VATLIKNKRVSQDWNQLCTNSIDAKRSKTTKRAFSANQELKDAVMKHCGIHNEDETQFFWFFRPAFNGSIGLFLIENDSLRCKIFRVHADSKSFADWVAPLLS
jgi:hypothetical protein